MRNPRNRVAGHGYPLTRQLVFFEVMVLYPWQSEWGSILTCQLCEWREAEGFVDLLTSPRARLGIAFQRVSVSNFA